MAEAAAEELVLLDRIGTVPQAGDELRATIFAPGIPEAALRRYEEDGRFTIVTEDIGEQIAACDAALLSTRNPRAEVQSLIERFRSLSSGPAVVLAHTGGEATAVELVRHGAVCVLGEGDELALATTLTGLDTSEGLLEAYDRNTATAGGDRSGRGIDPVTGLLDELAMRARVEELVHAGDLPRVAYARLLNTPHTPRELSYEGLASMRRRLASQFRHLTQRVGAELYSLSSDEFGVVGPDLSPNDAERLARSMQVLAGKFVPTGVRPLGLAFGHAGPEAATDGTMLLELAGRARDLASQDGHGAIVSAELLALGMASSTELATAMRTLEHVERLSHHGPGHGERVAELVTVLATELGYEAMARSRIRLAAHLHEIGKAQLTRDAIADPASLDGELLAAYRSHPILGAEFLRPIAGTEVAEIVRSYAERWDGAGFPDGITERAVPTGARLIAVAHAIDIAVSRHVAEHNTLNGAQQAAIQAIESAAGTQLDPDIVEVASALLVHGTLGTGMYALAV